MSTPPETPDHEIDTTDERGLETVELPMDDPQTRPALQPETGELGIAEREVPEDS